MFSFVNFTPTKIEAVIYNSCLNNNILYNNDTKIIYIKDLSTNKYYDIVTNDDFRENTSKSKIIIKQVNLNQWELMSPSNNKIKVTITNLVNNSTSNNINGYSFLTTTGRTYNNVEISLYTNYNNLQIQSYSYLKKLLSFNDINKLLPNKNKYDTPIERSNLYKNNEFILDKIYLDDIISISLGSQILYAQEDNSIILKREVSTDSKIGKYFIEVAIDSDIPNLYKLWNIDYEKMVIYDDKSGLNTVSLSHKTIKYNDIDKKNDLDISSVFEKIQNGTKYAYKLFNYPTDIYINPTEITKPYFSITKT